MGIDNLQDLRDVTIVAYAIAGTVMFLVLILFTLVLGVMSIMVLRKVRGALESARDTVDGLRGTATFFSETAVSPLIRAYGVFRGARRFMGVLGRVFKRG